MDPISCATIAVAATFTSGALLNEIQSNFIYPMKHRNESRHNVAPMFLDDGIPFSDTTLITEDGVKVRTYVCKPQSDKEARKRPTILILHGNRGNTGYQSEVISKLYHELKCNVVLPSYRGYDRSEGNPSEKGIKIDAQTFLNYVKKHSVLKDTKLIIFGRSLGGSVGIDLVSRNENKVNGLILENTFISIPKLLKTYFVPFSLITGFCTQVWSSEHLMGEIKKTPILFLTGGNDKVVPQEHTKTLYELTKTEGGKEWEVFPQGKHSDTIRQPGFFEAIDSFISKVTQK